MRFGMTRERNTIIITAKRNNWRPTRQEPELPEPLEYLTRDNLAKVGHRMEIPPSNPAYPLLTAYLKGDNPELDEIERGASQIAKRLLESGLKRQIDNLCGRLRRKGLDNPLAPSLVTTQLFSILRDKVSA
jgi:hypothetical protein